MKVIHFLAGLSLTVLLSACAVVNTAGDIAQGRQAMLEGKYQLALDYFWAGDQLDPHYMFGAELRASASDLGKGPFPSQERQCCAAIPWAYVVSSRGPKGGADEYPTRYERNL